MSDESISIEELTKERTPSELRRWWDRKNEEVYYSTNEGREGLILHNKKPAKQFVEEILPLVKFGERKFGDTNEVLLKPVIGNQCYDAVVTDLRTEPASQGYIEITQSHKGESGYLDFLRRLVLYNGGLVGTHDKVTRTGTKKTGMQVSASPEALPVEKVAEDEQEEIRCAAENKAGKNYPVNTSLVIFFDDRNLHLPRVVDDAQLDDFVNREILELDLRFSALYLVGLVNVFREYSLANRSNIAKR